MSNNINLIFNYQGNQITMQCQSNEKIKDVFKRFGTKVQRNADDFAFYYHAMEVHPSDKTLYNLQVSNYNTFNVVEKTIIGA